MIDARQYDLHDNNREYVKSENNIDEGRHCKKDECLVRMLQRNRMAEEGPQSGNRRGGARRISNVFMNDDRNTTCVTANRRGNHMFPLS